MNQQADADAQSALTILVPEAERLVAPFREKYDPSAMTGMSAHITLIYPFLPPDEIDALALGKIAECSARFAAFDFSLTGPAAQCFPGPIKFDEKGRRVWKAKGEDILRKINAAREALAVVQSRRNAISETAH